MNKVNICNSEQPSFVGAYYLSDLSICDYMIENHNTDANIRPGGFVGDGGEIVVDKSVKDSEDVIVPFDSPVYKRYMDGLSECHQQYKKDYVWSDRVSNYDIESLQTQRYDPGGGFKTYHTERMGPDKAYRHLVYMTYLNDVDDGGETEFYYQDLKVKPRKGLTLIWPADWTHTHRGIPSPSETKYIATGWWQFDHSPEVIMVTREVK